MQNTARLTTALFFSAFPYKRKFLHYIKENNLDIVISYEPWNEKDNIYLLKYFYSKKKIEYSKEKTIQYLTKKKSLVFDQIILWKEPEYPYLLKQIYDPPLVLFVKSIRGTPIKFDDFDTISIVGTRHPFPIALHAVDRLVELFGILRNSDELITFLTIKRRKHNVLFDEISNLQTFNSKNIATISGFAKGIDYRVHKASIIFKVPTIAILGSGMDFISPRKNLHLLKEAESMNQDLFLVSEFFPTFKAGKYTFPLRNRIIAGISKYLFIMQAGKKSGALISADYAIQENREIFCFDHPFFQGMNYNSGNQRLIEEGAHILKIDI